MSSHIVKQPDGRYAIYSTIVDDFTSVDNTPDHIIECWSAQEHRRLSESVMNIIAELNGGGTPYSQFTKTFDEHVAWIRKLHGNDTESLRHFGLAERQDDE